MALLELKLEGEQDTVKIGTKEYKLAPYESFSIRDMHKFAKGAKNLGDLGEGMTDESVESFEGFFGEWFEKIAKEIPDGVKDKIMPLSKMELVNEYFLSLAGRLEKQAQAASKNGRGKGSHPSQGSTRRSRSKSG